MSGRQTGREETESLRPDPVLSRQQKRSIWTEGSTMWVRINHIKRLRRTIDGGTTRTSIKDMEEGGEEISRLRTSRGRLSHEIESPPFINILSNFRKVTTRKDLRTGSRLYYRRHSKGVVGVETVVYTFSLKYRKDNEVAEVDTPKSSSLLCCKNNLNRNYPRTCKVVMIHVSQKKLSYKNQIKLI